MKSVLVLLALPAVVAAQQPAASTQQSVDSALRPITQQEAVRLAQRNAPAAVAARGQMRAANSSIRSAYGAFMPSLNFTLGQSQRTGPGRNPATGQIENYVAQPWSYTTGISSGLNLFDGGKRFADLRARRADLGSAEANETAQRFNIALQVKTQYAAILAARESEAAAQSQLDQAEQQLRAASARVMAGAATLSDSLRSVIQVGNARLALITAQNDIRVSSAALTRLVATPFLVTADPADTADFAPVALDSVALAALAERGPAVRQAEAQRTSAGAALRSSKTGYLPTIDLRYTRSGDGSDKYFGIGSGSLAYARTLSLNLNFPVFNNFSREEAVTRADVAEDNAEAQMRDARLAAQQNIIQQFGQLRSAEERIRIQQASVVAAQEDLRVQQQRYSLGASTLLDLLTSQSTLTQASAALIQARLDYRLARAQIEAIIGRDLQ